MNPQLAAGTKVTHLDEPKQEGTVQQGTYEMDTPGKEYWNYYVRWDNGKLGSVSEHRLIVNPDSKNPPYITGLHGCKCHPFESWEECEAAHTAQFVPGDTVVGRHNCNFATIIGNIDGEKYWWNILVMPGLFESDKQISHSANLILVSGAAPKKKAHANKT